MTPRRPVDAAWQHVRRRAARHYVTGPRVEDALEVAAAARASDAPITLGLWNRGGENPRWIAGENLKAADALAGWENAQLAVKLPPLGFDLDLVAAIVARCARSRIGMQIDALWRDTATPTLDLLSVVARDDVTLGCTLPGRWARSIEDAERAVELGLRVRVVKGQWPDAPAREQDPRRGFLAVVERLAGRARDVLLATHDAALADEALRLLVASGTPSEVELLPGLPLRAPLRVARRHGVAVRFYVPWGPPRVPYSLRSVGEQPLAALWFARDVLAPRSRRLNSHR